MGYDIPKSEIEKIPFFNTQDLRGRTVSLQSLWDGKKWHSWIPAGDKLIQGGKPVYTQAYYATEPVSKNHLYIPFVDLMWQQANFPTITKDLKAICDDFSNLAISLEKIQHFFNTKDDINEYLIGNFIATEIEYILISTRSIFDFLYQIIARFWHEHVVLHDPEAERKKKSIKLPKKLSSFLLDDGKPRSSLEIHEKFFIPSTIADAFAEHGQFFFELRKHRDNIVHHGSSNPFIFSTEKGFCIGPDMPFVKAFYADRKREAWQYNENLYSLLPWLAHLVHGTIQACNEITDSFARTVTLPPRITPDYKIFVNLGGGALRQAWDVMNGGSPWWEKTDTKDFTGFL